MAGPRWYVWSSVCVAKPWKTSICSMRCAVDGATPSKMRRLGDGQLLPVREGLQQREHTPHRGDVVGGQCRLLRQVQAGLDV